MPFERQDLHDTLCCFRSVAEKSWLARATGLGVAALLRNHVRSVCALQLRSSGVFFSVLLLLCFCVLLQLSVVQIAVEWCIRASRRVYVLHYCLSILIVLCESLLADRVGAATSRMRFEC